MWEKICSLMSEPDLTEWIIMSLTCAIAYSGYQTGKVHERIERIIDRFTWLTGAMESHSQILLMIEAKRGTNGEPIKTVWWDPTMERARKEVNHKEECQLDEIKIFMPEEYRKGKEKL